MKRLLVTTALEETWPKDSDTPVLFLGEWCRLYSRKKRWSRLNAEVLPYHWDNRGKLYQDYFYLNKLYEQTLLQLTELMNELHREDNSLRYWRIILGPWLDSFIQILYDRYLSIQTAKTSGKVAGTLIHKNSIDKWVPRDYNSFLKWHTTDNYNYYLYSQIIEMTGNFNFKYAELGKKEDIKLNNFNINYSDFLKQKLREIAGQLTKLIPNQYNQVVFVSSYFKKTYLMKLQLSLKQIPYLFPQNIESPTAQVDSAMRNKIFLSIGDGEFELMLSKFICKHIPINYIEAYKQMKYDSINSFPNNPKLIYTANAVSSDHFKFWSAYHVDRGTKLVGAQHGGHYGTGLWSSADEHELQIFDKYFTWGWKSDKYKNTIPIPSLQLSGIKKMKPNNNNKLMLITLELPQYSYHLYSAPIAASGMKSYLNDQYSFIRSLSKNTQDKLVVRLPQTADYNWDQENQLNSHFPNIQVYIGKKSFINQLKENSLIVCTYNATSFLESFSANIPTIMFWNPKHWELNPSAQPYYDDLRKMKILHDCPKSAASKVDEIISDPLHWWRQKEVQRVKNRFCQMYARTSFDSLAVLKKELLTSIK